MMKMNFKFENLNETLFNNMIEDYIESVCKSMDGSIGSSSVSCDCKCKPKCDDREGDVFTMIRDNPEKYILCNNIIRVNENKKEVVSMFYEIYGIKIFLNGIDDDYYTISDDKLKTFTYEEFETVIKKSGKHVLYAQDVLDAYKKNLDRYYNYETKSETECEVNEEYGNIFQNRSEYVIHTDHINSEITMMLKNFYYGVPNSNVVKFDKEDVYYYIDFLTYNVFIASNEQKFFKSEKIIEASKLLECLKECNTTHNIVKRNIDDFYAYNNQDSYKKDPESIKYNDTFTMVKDRPYHYIVKVDSADNLTKNVIQQIFDVQYNCLEDLNKDDIVYLNGEHHVCVTPYYNDLHKRYYVSSREIVEDYKSYERNGFFKGIEEYILKDNCVDDNFYGVVTDAFFNLNGISIYTDVMNQKAQDVIKAIMFCADNFNEIDFSKKNCIYSLTFSIKDRKAHGIVSMRDVDGEKIINVSELVNMVSPIIKSCYLRANDKNLDENINETKNTSEDKSTKSIESVEDVLDRAKELYIRKNHDYSINGKSGFDKAWEKMGKKSLWLRLNDKFSRVESLLFSNESQKVQDEKLEDTLIDIINYCAMGISKLNCEEK